MTDGMTDDTSFGALPDIDSTGNGTDGGYDSGGGHVEPEPTDSLRTFGAVVQGLREHTGLSREEFGELVRFSKHTVASIEQGRRMPDRDFVEAAESVLGDMGALRRAFPHVARQPGLAAWFRRWAQLEAEAISLYTYECRLIPGLLQTEAYARTLFGNRWPLLDEHEIETRLATRLKRQLLLRERPNTVFSFILEEHLFLRRMGGDEVTRELINHVLEVAALPNVEFQIMPVVRRSHAGVDGPMRLLETPEIQRYAYCEGQESGQFIAGPKVVSMLNMRYARMRSQALPLDASLRLLTQMKGTL